jgi:crotonobetaine/carnitine-CoA ligase
MNGRYLREYQPDDVTMVRLLERRAARVGNAVFYTWADTAETVGAFNARVNRMARNLDRLGVRAGTHVAVIMNTSPDYLALWFAIAKLGAVEIPINSAYHGDLLIHQLATSQATAVVVDSEYAQRVDALADQMPGVDHVVVRGSYRPSDARISWSDFTALTLQNDESDLGRDVPCDSIAGVIFTSGTTGPSKGVLLSHHYLAAYGLMYAEVNRLGSDDVIFNFLPFFHIGAKFLTLAALAMDVQMRLAPRLSVRTFWAECRQYGVTNFIAVGGICNMLLAQSPRDDDAATRLRTVYAVPDPADIHTEFETRFGCRMTTVYGSTEVGLPITRGPDDDYRPGSCGRVSPYYEVVILDEHDNAVPVGTVGQIAVRPTRPCMLGSGYIGTPERTVESWRNLWLHTGDTGRIDADGWCWFEDRASDSMRRRGENISSQEVENLAMKHPAVAEAAAVAVASSLGEDEVWLLVTLRDGFQLEYADLLAHCARTMPYFMIPRYFEIVTDFPRTPTAKVEKYRLRAAGPGPGVWDRESEGWMLRRGKLVSDRALGRRTIAASR